MNDDHAVILSLIVRLTLVTAGTFLTVKWLVSQLDPTKNQKKSAQKRVRIE